MTFILLLAAAASGQAEPPVDRDRDLDGPQACVPAQLIVPPFNNTAEAMDQSRIAATVVMEGRARAGGKRINVCRTSAVAPEFSEVEGVREIPVDPDYEVDEEALEEARAEAAG